MAKESKDKAKVARMADAEDMKKNLVSQYLHLGSAMKRCSAAVEAFATALNDAESNEEVLALLKAPTHGPMPTMPDALPFLTTGKAGDVSSTLPPSHVAAAAAKANSKKRAKDAETDAEDDGEGGVPKKTGREKKAKKEKPEKDPNAPKRPPSAYLMFQKNMRPSIEKKLGEGASYQAILAETGKVWKETGDEGQKPFKDIADLEMAKWKHDLAEYHRAKGHDPNAVLAAAEAEVEEAQAEEPAAAAAAEPALPAKKARKNAAKKDDADVTTDNAAPAAAPAKEKPASTRAKKGDKANATAPVTPAAAPATATPATAAGKKGAAASAAKPASKATPAAKPPTTSTPAGKGKKAAAAAAPTPAAEESSSDESSSSEDESSSDDDSD